jgi:hypothetical protein
MLRSLSKDLSQEPFGVFENHTEDINAKLMRKMSYNGQGISNIRKVIVNPIVVEHRPKHEGLVFGGQEEENTSFSQVKTTKITFVKERGT